MKKEVCFTLIVLAIIFLCAGLYVFFTFPLVYRGEGYSLRYVRSTRTITSGIIEKSDFVIPDRIAGQPVEYIGEDAFHSSEVHTIVIPNGVISIGERAFCECSELTSVIIPDGVTSIGGAAFYGCTSLESITIPDSISDIEWNAFLDCNSLNHITIPKGVVSIGDGAFRRCENLTSITIDADNPEYSSKDGVLFSKDRTRLILCPAGKEGACLIPDGVSCIDSRAFENCNRLTEIKVPKTAVSIEQGAFGICEKLTAITVDPDNPMYSSVDGVLFNKSKSELIRYPCAKTGYYLIPASVQSIGFYAFSGCSELVEIKIPRTVNNIEDGAFYECSNLRCVTILNSNCSIYHNGLVFDRARIYGYSGSMAEAYTREYGYSFVELNSKR